MARKGKPKRYHLKARSLAHALLAIAALGGITLAMVIAPNAFQVIGKRYGRGEWWAEREAERRRIREALESLRRRRLVEFTEKGKELLLTITEAGRRRIRRFEFDTLEFDPPKRWDGRWRVLIFDVPETKARERKALRDKLRDLGFYQLQKSVWVYPHHCHDEIDFIAQFLDIDRHISYLETESLERTEGDARKAFGLL